MYYYWKTIRQKGKLLSLLQERDYLVELILPFAQAARANF